MRIMAWVCASAVVWGSVFDVSAQEADDRSAIEKAIETYVTAFNDRDAKSLAAHWSPEGVYTSRLSGESVVGREALEKDFSALFEDVEDVRLEVVTDSIEFVSPNVAVEQGKATIHKPEQPPIESDYSVVYVQREGKWLIDRVSEEEKTVPLTHYEQLKELEWIIGEWVDQSGDFAIRTDCKWTRNQNYIVRAFTASTRDRTDMTGMQFIGWDAAREQIRSWVFDSDGGFAEGVWEKKDDRWIVETSATLPDGRTGSSTTVLRPLDENSFGWQKLSRIVDGEILPNIDEVVIVRQGTQP